MNELLVAIDNRSLSLWLLAAGTLLLELPLLFMLSRIRQFMFCAYLLLCQLPFLYLFIQGEDYATGCTAWYVAFGHVALGFVLAYRATPGWRLFVTSMVWSLFWSTAAVVVFLRYTSAETVQKYSAEYWLLTGSCIFAAFLAACIIGCVIYAREEWRKRHWMLLVAVLWFGVSAIVNIRSIWIWDGTDPAGWVADWAEWRTLARWEHGVHLLCVLAWIIILKRIQWPERQRNERLAFAPGN